MFGILTIDTNIWAYYFDKGAREHRYVKKPVEEALRSEQIVLNTVIVMEVAHFLVKNLGPMLGKEKLDTFLTFPLTVVDLDYRGVLESVEELRKYSHFGIGGRDATVLAFMRRSASKRIMTHDEALKKVGWLEVLDPVPEVLRE